MNRSHVSGWKLALTVLTILATGLPGCGTKRPPQEQSDLLERRREASASYRSQTQERYVALLQRTKADHDEYIAGRRPTPPVIDYLIISGGGDWGASSHPGCSGCSGQNSADAPPADAAPRPGVERPPAQRNGPRPRNYSWAELTHRVFLVDVLACASCGGRLRVLAAIHSSAAIRAILETDGIEPFDFNLSY